MCKEKKKEVRKSEFEGGGEGADIALKYCFFLLL